MRDSHRIDVRGILYKLKRTLATALTLGVLLFALHYAEQYILALLGLALPAELAIAVYLFVFGITALFFSYVLARVFYKIGILASATIASLSPKLKPVGTLVRFIFTIATLITFTVALLGLLSLRVSAAAEVVEWLASTLGGFFSMLIALILAFQVKEIVGNYLAWLIIKFGDLVEEGDFIRFNEEVLKVVRVGSSHTLLVNTFDEEVYIPNLKFLLDTYKKPFSRRARRYLEVHFTLPYSYPYREVVARVHKALQNLDSPEAPVASYRLLIKELHPYAVIYELRVKPSKPLFPYTFNSEVMRVLFEEFGEALSTPTLVTLSDRHSSEELKGKELSSPPSSEE